MPLPVPTAMPCAVLPVRDIGYRAARDRVIPFGGLCRVRGHRPAWLPPGRRWRAPGRDPGARPPSRRPRYHRSIAAGRSPGSRRTAMRLGFVGLGTMGAAMAANLLRAGHELTVWNRTAGRAGELLGAGAREVGTPAAVARASEVVLVCVSDTADVEAVMLGPDGVRDGAAPGSLVIDCSTIAPAGSRRVADELRRSGVAFVDAPVSGGSEGANNATLTI